MTLKVTKILVFLYLCAICAVFETAFSVTLVRLEEGKKRRSKAEVFRKPQFKVRFIG